MPLRILIVDDDPAMRRALEIELRRAGYDPACATDGQEAMRLVEAQPPDLLLTDCFLPKMDGVHLCKFLRADPRFRALPMILMSGTLEPEVLTISREFGIDAVFEKGRPLGELMAAIGRLLPCAAA